MKILHIADIHACEKHLEWVDKALNSAVEHAGTAGIDAWVIAGDSFDAAISVHSPAFSTFVRHIMALSEIAPGVILQGTASHDRPGSLDFIKELSTKCPIYIADQPGQIALVKTANIVHWIGAHDLIDAAFHMPSSDATVIGLFSCLPSLNKADPAIMERGTHAYLHGLFAGWAEANALASAAGVPTAMLTHGTINGSITESGYAMVSPDWEFDEASLYSAGTDAILMGHIHKRQDWSDGKQVIAYPGSIARLVYGDRDAKGFLMWDIFPGQANLEFIETPSRQLLEIEFSGPPDMGELKDLAAKADENTHVRIRWSIDQEHAHSIDKLAIRALFDHAAAVKIEGVINPVVSVRAAGIGKAMTIEEKLGYFLVTTGDENKMDALGARLHMLKTMDVDQIVGRIIKPEALEAT